jgi:hypothetical protein
MAGFMDRFQSEYMKWKKFDFARLPCYTSHKNRISYSIILVVERKKDTFIFLFFYFLYHH